MKKYLDRTYKKSYCKHIRGISTRYVGGDTDALLLTIRTRTIDTKPDKFVARRRIERIGHPQITMKLSEIQAIANLTAKFLGLKIKPRAEITSNKRGRAYTTKGWFSIPKWSFDHGEKFVIYYIVHEVCHFYEGTLDHGKKFCEVEDHALRFWGLYIQRKKVYPEPYAIYKL